MYRGTGSLEVRLPTREECVGDQDQEWCELIEDDTSRRVRFHDYAEIYRIPGLYERLFYEHLHCQSPQVVGEALHAAVTAAGANPAQLRVLDVGAGNGMVGERLHDMGARSVVGIDIIPEAKLAADRDRPHVYNDYLVADLTRLTPDECARLRSHRFNCLTCVAALGFGDIPPQAFLQAMQFVHPGGWLAFCIRDRFVSDGDASGFAKLIERMTRNEQIDIVSRKRYCHRLAVAGNELYYDAVIARLPA